MFYYIQGEVAHTEPSCAVIDCGGVGYKLTVSGNTAAKCALGKKMKLFTHLSVREDAVELFGFGDTQELAAFKMLISVSGIGPRAAMSILSQLTPEKFALAVTTGDTKAISKAPGVGAKTAARVVLELKDKIAKDITSASSSADGGADYGVVTADEGDKLSEAVNALLVLGYTKAEALSVTRALDIPSMSLEDIIREALKKLMKA
ncbi:MAG: Holliday junction branch migration protein RuvA [Clostridia bacterium]|nr:Holliday junction branch migration protein RuvA [Clostridia bacterium]